MDELGQLRVTVGKNDDVTVFNLQVDRFAAARDGECYLLGVVGSAGAVKGLRSVMNAKVTATIECQGFQALASNKGGAVRCFHAHETTNYTIHTHALGFGNIQALFLGRQDGFLSVCSDETVWRALKSPSYTTPLLRAWIPVLSRRLRETGKLQELYCFNCQCGLITATVDELDRLVEAGVRDGSLPFRELTPV